LLRIVSTLIEKRKRKKKDVKVVGRLVEQEEVGFQEECLRDETENQGHL